MLDEDLSRSIFLSLENKNNLVKALFKSGGFLCTFSKYILVLFVFVSIIKPLLAQVSASLSEYEQLLVPGCPQ